MDVIWYVLLSFLLQGIVLSWYGWYLDLQRRKRVAEAQLALARYLEAEDQRLSEQYEWYDEWRKDKT